MLSIPRGMKTQDVSKKGLKYGDEDEDEAEKKELEAQKVAFAPLIDWLKKELKGTIADGEFFLRRDPLGVEICLKLTVQLYSPIVSSPRPAPSSSTRLAGQPIWPRSWLRRPTPRTTQCSR